MTVEQQFTAAEASGQDGAYVRIDDTHPVDLFLGLEAGQRAILVRCPTAPPDPPNLNAIRVDARPRTTGGWALVLRLVQSDLKPLFNRFVEDLDAALRIPSAPPGPTVIARLVRWQRLFMPGSSTLLTENEVRGLCAELDFLIDQAVPALGARMGVFGWLGPYDAPKDFVFEREEVEVKAVHGQARSVRVSSMEQLTDEGRRLNLWIRVVELLTPAGPNSRTVSDLVASARAAVAGDGDAASRLEASLLAGGYEDRPEYDAIGVRFGRSRCVRVSDAFPRLQRPAVPRAIVACEYDLAIADLEVYRVDRWRA